MSDDLKSSADGTEDQENDPKVSDVTEELVDEVADSFIEDAAISSSDMVSATEGEGETEDTEQELEEEKVKDEIDIQIDLLQDPNWEIRREAIITLGEMADERCVVPVVQALRDGDWQVREAAVEALAEIGSPAVEMLIKHLRDWESRKYVVRALGRINDERVLDPLISVLRNDEFKDDATRALVDLGKPAVEKLIIALNNKEDREDFVRKQSIIALGELKDPAAVDPLIAMLQDQDWFIRVTAAGALEKIGDLRGREAIKLLIKDRDLVVRMRAERILASWKKQSANA